MATNTAVDITLPTIDETTFIKTMATTTDTTDVPKARFFRVSGSVAAKIMLMRQP
jgi:hypothetical protein